MGGDEKLVWAASKADIMNLGATIRVNKLGLGTIITVLAMIVMLYRYGNTATLERKPAMVSLKSMLSAAIDAAQRGGRIVYQVREAADMHEKSKGKTKEGANEPVTDGDLKSHLTMFYSLKKAFPGVDIISEEHDTGSVDVSSVMPASTFNMEVSSIITDDILVPIHDIRVWIDPLDATQEYTENLREYVTTMVCVALRGYATIGVIHKPFSNFTAWGWAGKGVSSELQMSVPQGGPKDDIPQIIVSRSHAGDVEGFSKAAFGERTKVIPAGGAGYKTLAVIQGDVDAYVHVTLIKKWDICAGNALLNALHGNMTTLDGLSIDYSSREDYKNEGGVLATLYLHKNYLPKLQELRKKKPH
ncbi:inositol monophosphatase 3 isoform X2 [Panulirus ornatus]|uniref:inositol monophosphatase 3 isoform X2 n=1 Tax=Panulirus ornatus TaxID=150431 RepID=UPI003A84420F